MIQKIYLSFALLLVISSYGYSQIENCPNPSSGWIDEEDYSHSIDPSYLANFEPVVLNVYFWSINKNTSPSDPPTIANESIVLQNIAYMNQEFNQFNIFFKYLGFDNTSFNSTEYYSGKGISSIRNYAIANGYEVQNALNIYVPGKFNAGGGQSAGIPSRFLGVTAHNFENVTITILHELGHALGLQHTENGYAGSNCERVTRNPADIAYNADSAGDFVVDTAAKPYFFGWNGEGYEIDIDINTCTYIGTGKDCGGTPYQIFESDVRNYMSKGYIPYPASGCHDQFTTGQKIRMHETIELADSTVPTNWRISQAVTTIASLYEPYSGEYNNSSPGSSPLFQPGFDYEFVECCCDYPLPSAYTDISFTYNATNILASFDADETNYSSIIHPNHSAIRIAQIPDPSGNLYQPRRCYDNNPESPIGGTITQFNDGTFTTNVTSWKVEASQITSERYLNSLPKGLYKIELEFADGTIEQKVVYKREDNE